MKPLNPTDDPPLLSLLGSQQEIDDMLLNNEGLFLKSMGKGWVGNWGPVTALGLKGQREVVVTGTWKERLP